MTLRLLPDDALKTGDPALTRYAPDLTPCPKPRRRTRGPAHTPPSQAHEHALDWLAHVEAGRMG